MSFREEERQKNGCSSRGLGLAAAAIGVGVGAALYYFFSKSPENPHSEGSTTGWQTETLNPTNCDQIQCNMDVDSDDYTTISENVTSDTSIVSSVISSTGEDFNISHSSNTLNETNSTVDSSESNDSFTVTDYDSDMDIPSDISVESHSESSDSIYSVSSASEEDIRYNERSSASNTYETRCSTLRISTRSGSSTSSGWEIINTFEWHSEYDRRQRSPIREFFSNIVNVINPRSHRCQEISEEEQLAILRDQAFRQRSWTPEECSICFEVMLRDQEVMTLPCTHHFHQACILPWLQEQQTCPNCRKRAE